MDGVEAESKPGTYPNLDDIIVEDEASTLLLPCIICNKTFKPEVLQRHSKVCEKNATKKRKIFDSFKQRVQGTELAEFLPFSSLQKRASLTEKSLNSNRKSSHWKENHEAFVSAIRAARGNDAKGGSGDTRSLLRPPCNEQCPYCERHFGPKAFDRHQEWCREHHSRHPPITASSQAKERLEARIKYRAPPLKSKRSITREKYSPLVQRKVLHVSPSSNSNLSSSTTGSATSSAGSFRHTSQSQQEQSNRLSKSGNLLSGRSLVKDSQSSLGFNRGMAGRTSLRASQRAMNRSVSPGKHSPSSGKSTSLSSAQRHSLDFSQTENYDKQDMMTSSCLKKTPARNPTVKQLDTKVTEQQKIKVPKKLSLSSAPTAKSENFQTVESETLPSEVTSKDPHVNTNLSKSQKNEQLWRQSCNVKHSPFHSPSSKPNSSIASSNVTPRSLLKEKGGESSVCSKVNSTKVNSLVDEMVVTQCNILKITHGGARYQKLTNSSCDECLAVVEEGISCADRSDFCDMYVSHVRSPVGYDIETGSACSLQFSSSTETPLSSRSADSNRTYVTQSSTCCKLNNRLDVGCEQPPIASSISNCSISERQRGSESERVCVSSGLYSKYLGTTEQTDISWVGEKRSDYQNQPQNTFDGALETNRLLNQVNTESPHKECEKRKKSQDTCEASLSLLPCPQSPSPHLFEEKSTTTEDRQSKYECNFKDTDIVNSSKKIHEQCSPVKATNDVSITTWHNIAKSGNRTSQYFTIKTYLKSNQLNEPNVFWHPKPLMHTPGSMKIEQNNKISSVESRGEDVFNLPKLYLSAPNNNLCYQGTQWNQDKLGHKREINLKCTVFSPARLSISDFHEAEVSSVQKLPILAPKASSYKHGLMKVSEMFSSERLLPSGRNLDHQQPITAVKSRLNITPAQTRSPSNYFNRNPTSVKLKPIPCSASSSGSRLEEPYDPYASAERQMMELLRSDSACNINQGRNNQTQKHKIQKHSPPSPAPSLSPMPSPTLSSKPSSLETSPTSAFTRYAKDSDFSNSGQIVLESVMTDKSKSYEVCEVPSMNQTESQHLEIPIASVQVNQGNEHLSDNEVQSKPQQDQSKAKATTLSQSHAQLQSQMQPQPPPRSNKRLAPLQQSKELTDLFVYGFNMPHSKPKTSQSLEATPINLINTENIDNRPKTYDVDSRPNREGQEKSDGFCNSESSLGDNNMPMVIESPNGGKVEVLNLENKDFRIGRRETRESREIREITEQEPEISDIDDLLEEVVRMQRSVSMLSEVDTADTKKSSPMSPQSSSARSRRNRTGKMHIEDFLFPAELLESENNNFRSMGVCPERSNSVFGSTKSRKSASKGRRLIEDMLFPPGIDLNANTHSNNNNNNEDGDVVVSANALIGTCSSPRSFTQNLFSDFLTSPVALTSKAPINCDDGDGGIPRPKPLSLSAHSTTGNCCSEGDGMDRTLVSTSHTQPSNQSQQSNSSRLSADSAYSRSPVAHVRRQVAVGTQDSHHHGAESPQSVLSQSFTQSLVLSSSGSESSLPPLVSSQSSKLGGRSKHDRDTPSSDIGSATTPLLPKLSKFCHQCGTKFLVTVSKFCHECGAARLEFC